MKRFKEIFKRHKIVRVLAVTFLIIAATAAAVILFLTLNPAFGGRPSKEDMKDYEKRADNYVDGKFIYPSEYEEAGLSENIIVSEKKTRPEDKLPSLTPSFSEKPDISDFTVTWYGHSTLLIQMHGLNILVDPVFSKRTSPVSFVGPKRFGELPGDIDSLPHIDVLLLSHDHYDHLDMASIKRLDEKTDRYIVPLGVEKHLKRWGVSSDKITNMAWWEETEVSGLTFGCTPARHFSNRSINDSGRTLFCSWVLKDEYNKVYESGDTGYGGHFKAVHDKYGDFDFVMTDCAQFNENWHNVHMYPEEAAMACETLGAGVAMPIHWGAFVLSSHPWDDPPERFTAAAEEKGIEVVTPRLGETFKLESYTDYQNRWWREVK